MPRRTPKGQSSQMTYARAGVDVERLRGAHGILAKRLATSFSTRKGKIGEPIFPIGHYAGLVDLGDKQVLGLHVDNVGTKVIIAEMMKKYDTIGIDCVGMCVNDLICTGLEPFAFLDYIATASPDSKTIAQISEGIVEGAKQAEVAVVGGETAVVPDLLSDGYDGTAIDLVGFAAGICSKNKLVLGDKVKSNDTIVGVSSSGIHSNGMTLARKVLFRKHKVNDWIPELRRSLGEELLEPTRIYVKPVMDLLLEAEVHGFAHITGGGFSKLDRIVSRAGLGAELDNLPDSPSIFQIIQEDGKISDREMYRTFNMGVGFLILCPKREEDKVIQTFQRYQQDAFRVGHVSKKPGIRVSGSMGQLSLLGKA
ncbi:MAG TPA: phosphoribosylformylglycinamidine cyclo-ligase [Candidatus Bathyarchaeia archaeon]|nr:phosphoribosylformylglycinamidine cyclo-ligase [Candidatus Bathyarchaeia archaeon]